MMIPLGSEELRQIEQIVGRILTMDELAKFDRAEDVSESVRATVVTIARQHRLLACAYLFDRVPNMRFQDVAPLVERITDEQASRQ